MEHPRGSKPQYVFGVAPCHVGIEAARNARTMKASLWIDRQQTKLLPVSYFMVTFTLPYQLRSLTWHHQRQVYSILFSCVASTLKDFGLNPKNLGAEIGMTMVLHTHNRQLDFHPHIHVVAPGGGVNKLRRQWKKKKGKYLFNQKAMAKVFHGPFLNAPAVKLLWLFSDSGKLHSILDSCF